MSEERCNQCLLEGNLFCTRNCNECPFEANHGKIFVLKSITRGCEYEQKLITFISF